MAKLMVRNLPEDLVKALKQRAAKHNRSARAIACAAERRGATGFEPATYTFRKE